MKTKDEGTAWLRSHGWVQCDRGWRKPETATPITQTEWEAAVDRLGAAAGRARDNLESALRYVEGERRTITTQQATTMQGEV